MERKLIAYKFVSHEVGPKPDNEITRLLEKSVNTAALTRAEKDRVAEIMYGLFGSHGPFYKLGGWEWPLWDVLPRFLVNVRHYGWKAYYAPDKTSLRKALKSGVLEMIDAPKGAR